MNTPLFSLEHMTEIYQPEQDWLFEKLLWKLQSQKHLVLSAVQGWGIQDYINELRFQLAEKNADMHTCLIDIRPAHSSNSFLDLFASSLMHQFPDETSGMEIDKCSMSILKIPERIARKYKIKIALFFANAHLFHRFRDYSPFLRHLKTKLRNQRNCVFCFYGTSSPFFRDLFNSPGPLSGFGQVFQLQHNPMKHRSASVRKLFQDHKKRIGYSASVKMSNMVDNNPFYLRLMAWHALLLTQNTCTAAIVERSINNLIHHYDHRFNLIVENLTAKQISILNALVEGNQKLFSESVREKYQLGSTSNIVRLKSSLENKGIIQCRRTEITFSDPVFREWLRRRYFIKS